MPKTIAKKQNVDTSKPFVLLVGFIIWLVPVAKQHVHYHRFVQLRCYRHLFTFSTLQWGSDKENREPAFTDLLPSKNTV